MEATALKKMMELMEKQAESFKLLVDVVEVLKDRVLKLEEVVNV